MSKKKTTTKSNKSTNATTKSDPDLVPLKEVMKKPAKTKGTKSTTRAKAPSKTSGLDAAAQVLKETGKPMRCKEMVEAMLANGLWKTGGKTPAATIYSAILREMKAKKGEARFKKTGRGHFALNG